jgi:hypothetical protein
LHDSILSVQRSAAIPVAKIPPIAAEPPSTTGRTG